MKVEKQFEAIKKTKKNQHHPTSLLAVVYFVVAVARQLSEIEILDSYYRVGYLIEYF